MASKKTEKVVIGSLMRNPLLLSQTEKYNLSIDDFSDKLSQHIFYAIAQIADKGSTSIKTQDIHMYLEEMPTGLAIFNQNNGIALLNDAYQLANAESFGSYYSTMKKENLLRDLKKLGFDTREFYEINPMTNEEVRINDKWASLEVNDIVNAVKGKFMTLEQDYVRHDETETQDAAEGLREMLDELAESPDIGLPLQGDFFNTICSGARKGGFYVRSGASGTSKTRQAVGDACHLAFPIRYNHHTCSWEKVGQDEKVLVIATEQSHKEIRYMMLAYVSGINEKKIRHNSYTKREREIIQEAVEVIEIYRENFQITRMPNPTIEKVKSIVRENHLLHQVQYVFYDYIFIGPSLLFEFRSFNLRNDEVLLMFSTALKDLAVELDIFVMTSTQANAKADDNKEIRGEGTLAGSRSIINKADMGMMMARPTKEELDLLKGQLADEPNIVTDIFKARAGEHTQVRIWSKVDLGTLRKIDLGVTNARLEVVPFEELLYSVHELNEPDTMDKLLKKLNF